MVHFITNVYGEAPLVWLSNQDSPSSVLPGTYQIQANLAFASVSYLMTCKLHQARVFFKMAWFMVRGLGSHGCTSLCLNRYGCAVVIWLSLVSMTNQKAAYNHMPYIAIGCNFGLQYAPSARNHPSPTHPFWGMACNWGRWRALWQV